MKDKKTILIIMILNIVINLFLFAMPEKKEVFPTSTSAHLTFQINEPQVKTSEVNQVYQNPGAKATLNDKDISDTIESDTTYLKNNYLNTYYVSYTVPVGSFRTEEKYREVTIIDSRGPTLSLKGLAVMHLTIGTEYSELGYEAIDHFDGDVTKLVKITGSVDYNKEGTYTLRYKARDKRGNETIKERTVVVAQGIVTGENTPENISDFDPTPYNNTVTSMSFTKDGFEVNGYVKNSTGKYSMLVDGPVKRELLMKSMDQNNYKGNIKLDNLPNGRYSVQIKSKKKENLLVKIKEEEQLVRAHIGSKLVTFKYTKDQLSFKIESFEYRYDLLIDPGHGGTDTGTVVEGLSEKELNLEVSMYEKKRYEEHGLKVKLIRTDETYGEMLGNKEWKAISKRAYTVGYYGVVSKFIYSNHHNSIEDPNFMGWEILVSANLTESDLSEEHKVAASWNIIYQPTENHMRMYARDYESGGTYNKINGQVYGFKDYYAVNRIPLKKFHVKAPIYEGSYMSNRSDFNWYYKEKNYKKVSEAKIKVYVEALGLPYKESR